MKYNDNGEYKDIKVKAFDTLPVGAEVDYDGETVPSGWTQVDDPNTYSEEEVRIGTWFGKPLYRVALSIPISDYGTVTNVALNEYGVDDSNIEYIYLDSCNIVASSIGITRPVMVPDMNHDNPNYRCMTQVSRGAFTYLIGSGFNVFTSFYLVIHYTKTTDKVGD